MSWISDVKFELEKLDHSKKSLKKFGITIGIVFLTIGLFIYFSEVSKIITFLLGTIGSFLFITGFVFPKSLAKIYNIWMGFALALGWVMSRILLTILFLFVLSPIGFIAKIFKKEFLSIDFKKDSKTYWKKKEESLVNYNKMY